MTERKNFITLCSFVRDEGALYVKGESKNFKIYSNRVMGLVARFARLKKILANSSLGIKAGQRNGEGLKRSERIREIHRELILSNASELEPYQLVGIIR